MQMNTAPESHWKPWTKKIHGLIQAIETATKYEQTYLPYGTRGRILYEARYKAWMAQVEFNKAAGYKVFREVTQTQARFAKDALEWMARNPGVEDLMDPLGKAFEPKYGSAVWGWV